MGGKGVCGFCVWAGCRKLFFFLSWISASSKCPMRRRGLVSVEEGLTYHAASERFAARKKDEKKRQTVKRATRVTVALFAALALAMFAWRRTVYALRVHAARNGFACATPAALWRRADFAVVVFANSSLPTFIYPRYEAISGDYVRSYETSPQCPQKTSRMRHKHVRAWVPMGKKSNLTGTDASCLQHYADVWKNGQC